ncbi:pseudouridine synthase [Annulohypoxylon maeteangense]|uniref:pseudouridine synthase n=1 Tax=Annulohypoxylon maeteangense TaxID=1927788 RepID=UPI002007595C|nr:pseudouridine synthase [Annulohypoxylon maeteangense]KAI0885368.1 pseudouridine synthase [Annulohypoxylon maeteangense]
MGKKSVYEKWTKEGLIKRIQALEAASLAAGVALPPEVPALPEKKKTIDPSKYSTRLVAFKLAYFGKRYGGFEFSLHANIPSIEEELWKAFVKACLIFPENPEVVNWDSWEYSKCGRTDKGVSAFGQVIVARVRSNRPLPKKEGPVEGGEGEESEAEEQHEFNDFRDELPYCKMLNRLLPPDIQMLAWCPTTPADFSARHDCRERQYRYFFTQPAFAPLPRSMENPDTAKTTKIKAGWLDIEAMRVAAKKFEGVHDFRNFCKIDSCKPNMNFERKVFESDIVEVKDSGTALPFLDGDNFRPDPSSGLELQGKLPKVYYLHVRGTAFLWHQIRCMAGVIFLVGQGLEDPSIVDKLLDIEAVPGRPTYILAEETPLVLWDCIFPRTEKPENALNWVHIGDDSPGNQHGMMGLMNIMWAYWRERKIDELLASQLLNVVSSQADITLCKDPRARMQLSATTRTFEGGNTERLVGKYQPIMQKVRLMSPAQLFDKEAKKKGYASVAEMEEANVRRSVERRAQVAAQISEPPPIEEVVLEEAVG